jgi:hypothetical protein
MGALLIISDLRRLSYAQKLFSKHDQYPITSPVTQTYKYIHALFSIIISPNIASDFIALPGTEMESIKLVDSHWHCHIMYQCLVM